MTLALWCDPVAIEAAAGCNAAQAQDAATSATLILWRLSGRRYGTNDLEIRPIHRARDPFGLRGYLDIGWGLPGPYAGPGPAGGMGLSWGGFGGSYGWARNCRLDARQLELPEPVVDVETVTEDGVDLDPAVWRFDQPNLLVRVDGHRWRHGQDLTVQNGAPGSWSVTLTVGRPVPADGPIAAAELAVELAKDIAGKPCRLPERVTQISKQGATFLLTDPMAIIEKGGVGLQRVDRWLGSVNPGRQIMPTQVWIPGETDDQAFRVVG